MPPIANNTAPHYIKAHLHPTLSYHQSSNSRNITVVCAKAETFSKEGLFNVFFAVPVSFLPVSSGSIHFRGVLDIIGDSNVYAELFSSQISAIQECIRVHVA